MTKLTPAQFRRVESSFNENLYNFYEICFNEMDGFNSIENTMDACYKKLKQQFAYMIELSKYCDKGVLDSNNDVYIRKQTDIMNKFKENYKNILKNMKEISSSKNWSPFPINKYELKNLGRRYGRRTEILKRIAWAIFTERVHKLSLREVNELYNIPMSTTSIHRIKYTNLTNTEKSFVEAILNDLKKSFPENPPSMEEFLNIFKGN